MNNPLRQLADSFQNYQQLPAFCIDNTFYTYRDLAERIKGIQNQILEADPVPNSNIGVMTFNDIETYASILAILFTGHAFVPINPDHPADRNEAILEQAEISIICSGGTIHEDFTKKISGVKLINTKSLQFSGSDFLFNVNENDLAYILFTSGSTGTPKGVPLKVSNLNAFLRSFFKMGYELDEKDRFLQMFDLTFDLSIMSYLAPLCVGACVYTIPLTGFKYMHVYSVMEEHQLTFTLMVPSILTHLRQYFDEIKLDNLKYSLFCGEALYEDITLEWAKCIPNAVIENVYGPTEATIFCSRYVINRQGPNKNLNGILSIGKAMDGVELMVFNDSSQKASINEKGELCIAGAQVTPGYWKNEEKNKEAFFIHEGQRFYKTGDLCYADESGDIFYSGRVDFQVKIQGFRVELGEIEFHARYFLKSVAAVAVAVQNDLNAWQINLFVESDQIQKDELLEHLKAHLPSYMIPSAIIPVPVFPLNTNGKVDRKQLLVTLNKTNIS